MDTSELLALYDRDLRIEIEIPGVRKEVLPQLVRMVRPAPGMNQVLYSKLSETDLDAVIQEQIAYFSRMDQPFSWHVYDHDTPVTLRDRLESHGFVPDDDPDAVMVLDARQAPPALLEPVRLNVVRLTRRDQLRDIIHIEAQVWGGDFSWLADRLGPHLEMPGFLSVYAAYVERTPVCSGWVYFYPGSQFAVLFGGATVPEFRRQGLYTAVLAVRVQESLRRGYRFLTTGASPESRPILANHGFQLLTFAHAYEWKGLPGSQT